MTHDEIYQRLKALGFDVMGCKLVGSTMDLYARPEVMAQIAEALEGRRPPPAAAAMEPEERSA